MGRGVGMLINNGSVFTTAGLSGSSIIAYMLNFAIQRYSYFLIPKTYLVSTHIVVNLLKKR